MGWNIQFSKDCILALLRVGSKAYLEGRYSFYLLRIGVDILFDFFANFGVESFPYCIFFKINTNVIESQSK